MFCNWSNWSGLSLNFLSAISLTTCTEHSRAWNVGFFVLDMYICTALFKHFTVLGWFPSIALRILSAHHFFEWSARAPSELDRFSMKAEQFREITGRFLLNELGDPHFLIHKFKLHWRNNDPCTSKRRLSQKKNRDKDAAPLFAVPEYCRASYKCFKGCNKSQHFTPWHSSNNRWLRRSSRTRHSTWRASTKSSLRSISKEYEYRCGCKVRRVVQIHADICTALS